MAIVEKIKFDFPVLQHETIWDSKDGRYLDIVYIAIDESVSFTVYSYDPEDFVLRNLYVTEKCRKNGIATSVIMSIQKYCDATGRTLSLWAKGWLIDWYISLGFKTGNQFDEDGSVWLTYNNSKNNENEIEQITC